MIAEVMLSATVALWPGVQPWPTCEITYSTNVNGPALRGAVRDIERVTGIDFRRIGISYPADLKVVRVPGPGPYVAVVTWDERGKPMVTAWDQLFIMAKADRRRLWQHELGHVLGLAHSDDQREVMYQYPTGRPSTKGWKADLSELYAGRCKR